MYLLSTPSQVNSIVYEHINDCTLNSKGVIYGVDELTFYCGERNRENRVFTEWNKTSCSNTIYDTSYKWPGTVNFRNCRFPQINRNYFEMFGNMHTFNISNVELDTMQLNIFRAAKNLTILDISRNKLNEIPFHIFFNAAKLKFVDFSNNSINRIDPTAFEGATNLETLNLSHNNISELQDAVMVCTPKLLTLNLSYNNITNLTGHIFDKLNNLELLDLSFNAIGKLDIKIFSCLASLKQLYLKRTNLSNIELGTFSQQSKLISLDLSENQLTRLDFKLFLPVLPDLETLILANNQLNNLHDYQSEIFPKLKSLQIHGNQFSCAYLAKFFDVVNWETIQFDLNTVVLNKSNIHGISCNESMEEMKLEKGNDLLETWNTVGHNDNVEIERSLTFICVALAIFIVLFIVVNSNHIYDRFKKAFKICQRIRMYSSDGRVVEFTNEQILIT